MAQTTLRTDFILVSVFLYALNFIIKTRVEILARSWKG